MRSLTLKLTLAFLIVGLTGAVLVALFVGQRTKREFDSFLLNQNQALVLRYYASYYVENGSWDGVDEWSKHERPTTFQNRESPRSGTLIDENGIIISGGARDKIGQPLAESKIADAIPIIVNGTRVGGLIFDLRPPPIINTPEDVFLDRVREAVILGALGATVAALLIGVLLARTITRPVHELTDATQRVAGGELGHQVSVRGRDEIAELGHSFNAMSTDLARSTQLRRQMTADIAHDLRTPLTVILGYTEALSDGKLRGSDKMYQVIHGEAQHLQRLIDDLRTLSLADAGELSLNLQATAPVDMLERAAAAHLVQAQGRDVSLTVDAPQSLSRVLVDPERMAQVLGNLISNALRYTSAGGRIELQAAQSEGIVNLVVSDDGAGIAPEDLPNIFERFYRADSSRQENGESGLGLPIAKSIVEAHGGAIFVASQPGEGTTFTIGLPVHA